MLRNHFKISLRMLIKRRGFAVINILGLALGFASSILIFLFVSFHLSFDTFHQNADRIYRFNTEEHRDIVDYEASVPPGFANAFRQDYDYAEYVAKIADDSDELITVEGRNGMMKFKEDVVFAEAGLFSIFNYPLIDGSHNAPITEPNTALITRQLAQKLFGDDDPVNRTFTLGNKETITVTGVLEDLPATTLIQASAFISYETLKDIDPFLYGENWNGIKSSLHCFALLRPNQNRKEIEEVLAAYVPKYRPDSKNVHHYKLQPLSEIHFNSHYSGGIDPKILWIFSFIGLFILVVASINFINISTAQSVHRSKEIGVRKVLGSLKGQLFRQFMTETFIVCLVACLFGLIISLLVLPYFNALFDLHLGISGLWNVQFLVLVVVLMGLVTFLAGSYPALLLARIMPVLALKRKLTHRDTGGFQTRKALVVLQFVISTVLIIASIVIGKQLRYAINSDLGFEKGGVVMIEIPDEIATVRLASLKDRLAQAAGVEKITACFASPGAGEDSWGTSVRFNNKADREDFNLSVKAADRSYLNTFDLRLVAGRNFYEKKDTVDEVLVNEDFVRKVGLTNPEDALGKAININTGFVQGTIVGVVADFHDQDFHEHVNPVFIAPDTRLYNELAIKINLSDTRHILNYIEKEWQEVFPEFLFEYEFLDSRVAELYKTEQQFLSLISLFSGLAIFIGCLGIYGLILFFVLLKSREISIRKVLGSSVREVLVLVVRDFFYLIVIAGLIAIPIGWVLMDRWLQNFEFKTDISWWIFLLAILIVLGITILTIAYQALRAAMANPVKSLRRE